MEEYVSSSEESSLSVSSASEDDLDDNKMPGHSQNLNSKCLPINTGMQQTILEQPSLYRCPFCSFQATIEKAMQDHLVFHFTKSEHQCRRCSFSFGTVPELYLHIQQHHAMEDERNFKVKNQPPGGKKTRVRLAIFKCDQCEFVTKYHQDLQKHEILHKEKSKFQCKLCSYSVSTSFCLTRHTKRHHSAQKNTPASTYQLIRTGPPTEEAPLEEVRAEPIITLEEQVQLQPVTQNKWIVESYQARDGRYLAPRPSEEERRTRKGLKPAQHSMTAFKASQRRKIYSKTIMKKKKLLKFRKKKPKPQVADVEYTSDNALKKRKKKPKPKGTDVALPVSTRLNPLKDVLRKKTSTVKVDVTATGRLENIKESSSEQKEVKFKCADCDYSTLRWDNIKRHRVGHEREEKFKCDHCDFSSSLKCQVNLHSSRFHRNPSAAHPEVKKENNDDSKELIRKRIENMKTKVCTAEQEKKQILTQKKDVEKKIKKMEEKKLKLELALRKLMEKQLNSSGLMDVNRQIRVIRIQEKTRRLKNREKKLKSLKKQVEDLVDEEKNAESSLIGAEQVLLALESELIKVEL